MLGEGFPGDTPTGAAIVPPLEKKKTMGAGVGTCGIKGLLSLLFHLLLFLFFPLLPSLFLLFSRFAARPLRAEGPKVAQQSERKEEKERGVKGRREREGDGREEKGDLLSHCSFFLDRFRALTRFYKILCRGILTIFIFWWDRAENFSKTLFRRFSIVAFLTRFRVLLRVVRFGFGFLCFLIRGYLKKCKQH